MARNLAAARQACPSLKSECVIAEGLRHTAAMELLQDSVVGTVVALWLGHESVETTYVYRHSDLKLKEAALAKTTPTQAAPARNRPDEEVLAFLNGL